MKFAASILLVAFALLLAVSDFRLAQFQRDLHYARLPIAAEDIYTGPREQLPS